MQYIMVFQGGGDGPGVQLEKGGLIHAIPFPLLMYPVAIVLVPVPYHVHQSALLYVCEIP
jgi:hypothetical protein